MQMSPDSWKERAHYNPFMPPSILRLSTALVLVLCTSIAFPATTRAETNRVPDPADTPYDLINAVNVLRASYGLPPYSVNSILMAAAQGHADYMAATGKVSHTGAGGSSATDRLLALGYPLAGDLSLGGFRSENVTSGNEGMTAQDAVNRWTGDALHLNTMISPDLTEIGAGVTVNRGRVYYVIDCARPIDSGVPQVAEAPDAGGPTPVPGVSGIIIPVEVVTPNADGDVIHEVKAGQSLWEIAISYNTRIDEIKQLNNLFDNQIYPGSRLLIKRGVLLTATAPVDSPTPGTAFSLTPIPTVTGTVVVPTLTRRPAGVPATSASSQTLQIAIGILALAVLGGGVVAWWGSKKK